MGDKIDALIAPPLRTKTHSCDVVTLAGHWLKGAVARKSKTMAAKHKTTSRRAN